MPAPAIVLGMLLRPYSIGHELCLLRYGNPLAEGNESTPNQLSRAVLTCCQSWRENQRMIFDPLLSFKLLLWRFRRNVSPALRKLTFQEELKTFTTYRDAGSLEFPLAEVVRPDRGPAPRPPGSPFQLRLYEFLHQRWTREDAKEWRTPWDYPLGLAKMRWASHWEEEGGLEVQNHFDAERDRKEMEFWLEQEKEGQKLCRA